MEEFNPRHNLEGLNKSIAVGNKGPLSSAWAAYYQFGDTAPLGTPRAYGIIALKKELLYLGSTRAIVPTMPSFGDAVRNAVKDFQRSHGLTADGVVGPRTARAMFRTRIFQAELDRSVPDHLSFKQIDLESGFDPGATGSVDPKDRGLCQINFTAHPDITDDKAFDPSFAVPWAADYLMDAIEALHDVDAGLAAYNVGRFYAKKWLDAGKPASGLMTVGGKDYAAICTNYVKLVKSRTA